MGKANMELVDNVVCELSHWRHLLPYRAVVFLLVYTDCQETMDEERAELQQKGAYQGRSNFQTVLLPRRYGEIKKGLLRDIDGSQEIAPRVLSPELKTLAAFGLIKRTDYQVVLPR